MGSDRRYESAELRGAVAAEIRAVLARRRMSQAQLARLLGVGDMWVSSRIASARTPLDLDEIQRIADILGVPAESFFPEQEPA